MMDRASLALEEMKTSRVRTNHCIIGSANLNSRVKERFTCVFFFSALLCETLGDGNSFSWKGREGNLN